MINIENLLINLLDNLHNIDLGQRIVKYTQQKKDEELLFKTLMDRDLRVEDVKDEYKDLARIILKHKEAKNAGK